MSSQYSTTSRVRPYSAVCIGECEREVSAAMLGESQHLGHSHEFPLGHSQELPKFEF